MSSEKYYLSSLESIAFEPTRECAFVKKLAFTTGKECMLVKVDPPVIGQPYGLGAKDIEHLLLANRHEGESLFPISGFPCFVHIARLLIDDTEELDTVKKDEVENIAWGELYRTKHDADNHIFE